MLRYSQFSREYVLFDLDMIEGWVWLNLATESDPWISVERTSPGYIAQEIERLKTCQAK